jgi:hypothetical protein
VKSAVKDKKLLSKAYLVETLLVGWYSSFWSGVIGEAVVVAADSFKETDVIYQMLQSMDDVVGTAELVQQFSTDAASSLLVAALNEGRDIIFDGTMSWEPYVLQTIAMVRDVHRRYTFSLPPISFVALFDSKSLHHP